jgi:hypothetical protein
MPTNTYPPTGRMDLETQGYRLSWGPKGLVIQVIDYHAKQLGLPWSLLRELADAETQGSVGEEAP